ncbi:hypothetical protein NE237_020573 [Protea cynaroides]|uniref:Vacuolar iron transporter n=1 Tax=Protea cynaroides TaxID=273540 RepID=A0A9Q0K410_9MAGN|nr:hypothetical protein NE237_020573 [Protea cynaroides]
MASDKDVEPQKKLLDYHEEKHFTAGEIVRDFIIGVSDCPLHPYILAAKSEADHYARELKRGEEEIIEVAEILSQYGLQPHVYEPVVNALRKKPHAWLFMMESGLGLEKPDPKRALQSALTIAISYIIGGLKATMAPVGLTLVALLFFGYVKAYFTGNKPF